MEPIEPIPLRALTVLLNYERMISHTRFESACIIDTSTVDPGLIQRLMMLYPSQFIPGPATTEYVYEETPASLSDYAQRFPDSRGI
jgi:hypothetical protein